MNLDKGFSDSTVDVEKIGFGLRRTNILKATTHWYQDFRRISTTTSLIDISNADEFCAAIEAARQRVRIRNYILE